MQAPPNLSDSTELGLLLRAGVDDWGGVSPLTPDHVNPERPWPKIEELAALTAEAGFDAARAAGRAAAVLWPPEPWLDPRLRPHVAALAGPDGLAVEERIPAGLPWQEPDAAWTSSGRTDLHVEVDTDGPDDGPAQSDFDDVYGDWAELRERTTSARDGHSTALAAGDREVLAALLHAEQDPAGLSDAEYLALLGADGTDLENLCALADAVRADVNGDDVTYVVNRNINFTNVCYTGCRFCAFAQRRTDADAYTLSLEQVGDRVDEAWAAGATEICMQGGIHPDLPGTAYFDLAREVKRRQPGIHLHASQPDGDRQRRRPHRAVVRGVPARRQGGRARLGARHGGRDPRRRRPLGADQGQAADGDLAGDHRHRAPRSACRRRRR